MTKITQQTLLYTHLAVEIGTSISCVILWSVQKLLDYTTCSQKFN